MSSIHSRWLEVPETEIGDLRHVDHHNYLRWMRSMHQEHFALLGFDRNYFIGLNQCFVVRRHKVEHLSPCFQDDRILMVTWISEVGAKTFKRNHRILKINSQNDAQIVLKAQNLSIFVDDSIKSQVMPADISSKLIEVSDGEVDAFIQDEIRAATTSALTLDIR